MLKLKLSLNNSMLLCMLPALLGLALACGGGGGGNNNEGASGNTPKETTIVSSTAAATASGQPTAKQPEQSVPVVGDGGDNPVTVTAPGLPAAKQPEQSAPVVGSSNLIRADQAVITLSGGGESRNKAEEAIKASGARVLGYNEATNSFRVELPSGRKKAFARELAAGIPGAVGSRAPVYTARPIEVKQRKKTANDYGDWNSGGTANWGLRFIHVDKAWDYSAGGASVAIGVLDADIYETPDLSFTRIFNYRQGSDSVTHGTHVSGTIGAKTNNAMGIAGLNWNIALYAADTSLGDGSLEPEKGLDDLLRSNCRVMNCSFGCSGQEDKDWYENEYLPQDRQLMRNIFSRSPQLLIVQAAGNDACDSYYAGWAAPLVTEFPDNIIAVAACNETGGSRFSNWGDRVEIAAPGEKIYSTVRKGYQYYSGTSMAAPHVTGVAALILSINPDFTARQVKQLLLDGARSGGRTIVLPGDPSKRKVPVLDAGESLRLAVLMAGGAPAPQPDPPPVGALPIAVPGNVTTDEETPVNIHLEARGDLPEGAKWSGKIVSLPLHGQVKGTWPDVVYTPQALFIGSDRFSFTVNNSLAESAPAWMTIFVKATMPVPVAVGGNVEVRTGQSLLIEFKVRESTMPPAGRLVFIVKTPPGHGALIGAASTRTYEPVDGYFGWDQVVFAASNSREEGPSARIDIRVRAGNEQPVADGGSFVCLENHPVDILLRASGPLPTGSKYTYRITSQPSHGRLSGSIPWQTYTPAKNWNGEDSFSYVVSNGIMESSPGAVGISVQHVNQPPKVDAGDDFVASGNSIVTLAATAQDAEDGTALVWRWTQTEGASVELINADTSRPSFLAPLVPMKLVFMAEVADSNGAKAQDSVAVLVLPEMKVALAVQQDGSVEVWRELAGWPVSRVSRQPLNGKLEKLAQGRWVYSPSHQYFGLDSVELVLVPDIWGREFTVRIVIEVLNTYDPPVVSVADNITTSPLRLVQVEVKASSPDQRPVTISWHQSRGPRVELWSGTQGLLSFIAPERYAELGFTLVADDGKILLHRDVSVLVEDGTSGLIAVRRADAAEGVSTILQAPCGSGFIAAYALRKVWGSKIVNTGHWTFSGRWVDKYETVSQVGPQIVCRYTGDNGKPGGEILLQPPDADHPYRLLDLVGRAGQDAAFLTEKYTSATKSYSLSLGFANPDRQTPDKLVHLSSRNRQPFNTTSLALQPDGLAAAVWLEAEATGAWARVMYACVEPGSATASKTVELVRADNDNPSLWKKSFQPKLVSLGDHRLLLLWTENQTWKGKLSESRLWARVMTDSGDFPGTAWQLERETWSPVDESGAPISIGAACVDGDRLVVNWAPARSPGDNRIQWFDANGRAESDMLTVSTGKPAIRMEAVESCEAMAEGGVFCRWRQYPSSENPAILGRRVQMDGIMSPAVVELQQPKMGQAFVSGLPGTARIFGWISTAQSDNQEAWLLRRTASGRKVGAGESFSDICFLPKLDLQGPSERIYPGSTFGLSAAVTGDSGAWVYAWSKLSGFGSTQTSHSLNPEFTAPESAGRLSYGFVGTDFREVISGRVEVEVVDGKP